MESGFSSVVGSKSHIVVGFRMNGMLKTVDAKCQLLIFPLKEEGKDGVKGISEGLVLNGRRDTIL